MAFLGIAILAVIGLLLLAGWLQGSVVCAVILWLPTAVLMIMLFGGPQPVQYHQAWIALAVSALVFALPRLWVEEQRSRARKVAGLDAPFVSPSGRRP